MHCYKSENLSENCLSHLKMCFETLAQNELKLEIIDILFGKMHQLLLESTLVNVHSIS